MRDKTVLNGKFHVFEDGRIYGVSNGYETPARVCWTSQGRKYGIVTFFSCGIQKHEYVHRLIALAFVPNPNNYPQVNHIDGNTKNNSADNLEWVTPQMNIQHAYKIGLIDPYSKGKVCSVCGKKIGNGSSVAFCKDCFLKHLKSSRRHMKRADKTSFITLSGRNRKIMEMWANGSTYQEIGREAGISKQRVYQIVKKLLMAP